MTDFTSFVVLTVFAVNALILYVALKLQGGDIN